MNLPGRRSTRQKQRRSTRHKRRGSTRQKRRRSRSLSTLRHLSDEDLEREIILALGDEHDNPGHLADLTDEHLSRKNGRTPYEKREAKRSRKLKEEEDVKNEWKRRDLKRRLETDAAQRASVNGHQRIVEHEEEARMRNEERKQRKREELEKEHRERERMGKEEREQKMREKLLERRQAEESLQKKRANDEKERRDATQLPVSQEMTNFFAEAFDPKTKEKRQTKAHPTANTSASAKAKTKAHPTANTSASAKAKTKAIQKATPKEKRQ